ncbi:DHA2 family efflux MFS transporter permease subunit [Rhodobacteraceae bacterium B1Z28]|uniref:DHA2 family efflux MFS transporter permease subunit n=1 Tax=Ruegeria haliotis TaxID=2747601 RepID=A0ABX2PMH3_9RHOB|nr:DHA2 family efflux MFS transporter permease subunit [Ruegeria haliotis]NVO54304.1 DHA2 family efflux MFS transporter permease subunit [Ruegeria haliotis]
MTTDAQGHARWWILGAMGAVLGVILLDETVISVALPTIQKDLGLSRLNAHWIVNIYLLVLACFAGAAGHLGDVLGVRWLLSAGLLIFGLASAFGGFSENGLALMTARAVQGVGAALIFPLSLVVLIRSFSEDERGLALGLYGGIGTIFLSLGPLVGGLLTEYLSWRWIFWVNPPIVLIVSVITWTFWRDQPHHREQGFDWKGLLLLVTGLAATVFCVMEGPDRGWIQPKVLVAMSAGLILLSLFVFVEMRTTNPMIAVSLFADRNFAASNLILMTAQFGKIVLFVFGASYFQSELRYSPLAAGAALLPIAIPQVFIAPLAGKIADQFGTRKPPLIGLLCGVLALLMVSIGMLYALDKVIFLAFLAWGCCVPLLFVPPRRAVMSSVPPNLRGQASGISMTFQLLGGTVGMALGSTVFAITSSFPLVFAFVAALATCVLAYSFVSLDRQRVPGG